MSIDRNTEHFGDGARFEREYPYMSHHNSRMAEAVRGGSSDGHLGGIVVLDNDHENSARRILSIGLDLHV